LVGLNGEFGFAPANYIEISGEAGHSGPQSPISTRSRERDIEPEQPTSPTVPQGPAAALAGIMHTNSHTAQSSGLHSTQSPPSNISLPPRRPQYTPNDSDESVPTPPPPSLPQRPPSQQLSPPLTQYASPRTPDSGVAASPPYNRAVSQNFDSGRGQHSQGGYHLYNINEMVSALGKKKKLATTLGLNLATGNIMIAPEKSRDGPQQTWSAEKLTHYSIEGKHVFMELVRPSKSIDFHAGTKDTAQEIVAGLGEIAGAARAEGLREVLEAGAGSKGGQKKGKMLYEFMAQGEDEVTVAVGDEVIVIDDSKSDEWWMIRRLKNGKEGVVPSSYVDVTGIVPTSSSTSGLNAGRSVVEQNRLEEEQLAKEATRVNRRRGGSDAKGSEVGPGVKLPERGSSLMGGTDGDQRSSQRSKKDGKVSTSKSSMYLSEVWHGNQTNELVEPDAFRTRTWTDRSGSFKVEAEFIGLKDGKIHLHKLNGVKIAVPVVKMAIEDLEYVEKVTGVSLDDDKPLSDIKRRSTQSGTGRKKAESSQKTGASVERPKQEPKGPEYDWFDFFLKAGVNPYQCERYASSFTKDSMDESVLPDITPSVLRALGLKEGDVLRVMKFLDNKYGRTGAKSKLRNVSFGGEEVISGEEEKAGATSPNGPGGGLFSGPGGALRNNTRKGRPAPAVQNDDVVDASTFRQKTGTEGGANVFNATTTPSAPAHAPPKKIAGGFDDDAWDIKPSKQRPSAPETAQPAAPVPATSAPSQPALTGSMAELSLLSPPLQPTPAQPTAPQQPPQLQSQPPAQAPLPPQLQQQPTGANPSFFSQLGQQPTGAQFQQQQAPQALPLPMANPQQQFQGQQQVQQNIAARQRPQAPPSIQQGSFMLPPPPRPLSAPQKQSLTNGFGPPPLQPQLTGFQNPSNLPPLAPPGQTLNDMSQMRNQQQYGQQQMYPQQTGFGQPNQNFGQFGNGLAPQQTGFGQQPQQLQMAPQQSGFQNQQPFMNGQQTGSPFADPRTTQQPGGFLPLSSQPTGFQQQFQPQPQFQPSQSPFQPLQPQPTGLNSILPPALQPQPTGITNGGFPSRPGFGQSPSPIPPMPPMPIQQPTLQPLQPHKTGPPPPVRFGVGDGKKLLPQPTGRKANLSHASGFSRPVSMLLVVH